MTIILFVNYTITTHILIFSIININLEIYFFCFYTNYLREIMEISSRDDLHLYIKIITGLTNSLCDNCFTHCQNKCIQYS